MLGRASEDPSYLLGLIEGALTESALDIALRAKIDKIDVIETAVSDESQVREDDDIALAQSISNVSARLNIGGDVYSSIVAVDTKAQAASGRNETTASQVTSLQSRIDNGSAADFAPNQKWDFTNTLDGWSTGGWTAETLPTSVRTYWDFIKSLSVRAIRPDRSVARYMTRCAFAFGACQDPCAGRQVLLHDIRTWNIRQLLQERRGAFVSDFVEHGRVRHGGTDCRRV